MLDPEILEDLKSLPADDGGNLLVQFGKMFLIAYPTHLEKMQRFLNSKDFSSLEKEAHTLKSVCHNLGATALADLSKQIEQLTRIREMNRIPQLLLRMKDDYAPVKQEIVGILKVV